MTGPHYLSEASVRRHARSGWKGVYVLRKSKDGPPRYVGRSDTDVERRLLQRARQGEYSYFSVEHKRTTKDAWHREANLYHRHISTVDNERHPAAPAGMTCPRCSRV